LKILSPGPAVKEEEGGQTAPQRPYSKTRKNIRGSRLILPGSKKK
jgi:hypothetical protein